LNVVLEFKNEKCPVVKDQNVDEEEVDDDRNVFEFICRNVRRTENHQTHKSVDLNVLHIGIQKSGHLAAIRVNLNMRHQSQLFGQDESRVLMTKTNSSSTTM